MNHPLALEHLGAYMLKVMRHYPEDNYESFKEEFKYIRHGHYFELVKKIGANEDPVVACTNGLIKTRDFNREQDGGFLGFIIAGTSMKVFYTLCHAKFGDIEDKELCDLTYYHLVMFEVGLRFHGDRFGISPDVSLEALIKALGEKLAIGQIDLGHLHNGRKFINMVKHPNKKNLPFANIQEGLRAFKDACRKIIICELNIGIGLSFSYDRQKLLADKA